MPIVASSILSRATGVLQDPDNVRWPLPELCDWLNEAQRAVVMIKPNALSQSVTITLAAGTRQALPSSVAIFTNAVCNIEEGQRGVVIRPVSRRETIDAHISGWHDPAKLPFAKTVSYVWQDASSPREFYVLPGNDGTGQIEAVVGLFPTDVAIPDVMDVVTHYTTVLQFADVYQGVLLDLTLARAMSKDMDTADNVARAAQHLQLAAQALTALGAGQAAAMLSNIYAPAAPR